VLEQEHETVRQNERLRLLDRVRGGLAHQMPNGIAGPGAPKLEPLAQKA